MFVHSLLARYLRGRVQLAQCLQDVLILFLAVPTRVHRLLSIK